jgi:hypothetical protein
MHLKRMDFQSNLRWHFQSHEKLVLLLLFIIANVICAVEQEISVSKEGLVRADSITS